jgi:hypothetical protein
MSKLNGGPIKLGSILYHHTLWAPGSKILTKGNQFHHRETTNKDL